MGIAENVGHIITFEILTNDTMKIINRFNVRYPVLSLEYSLRIDPLCGESTYFIKFKSCTLKLTNGDENLNQNESSLQQKDKDSYTMALISPSDLVGGSFLIYDHKYGGIFRV